MIYYLWLGEVMDIEGLKEVLINHRKIKNQREKNFNALNNDKLDRLITTILQIFEDEMLSFSFDDTNELTYLFLILDMLSLVENNKNLEMIASTRLKKIHHDIKEIIVDRPTYLDKNANSRYEILKNLITKMEDVMLRIMYNPTSDYDKTKSEFIAYLIFKYKNYDLVETAIEKYPHIVNLRNNSISLLEGVVSSYLEKLKFYLDSHCDDGLEKLIYYKDIYKLLLSNEKLVITVPTRRNILKKIKTFIEETDYSQKQVREKKAYYTNYLLSSIDEEKMPYEDLDYEFDIEKRFNSAIYSEVRFLVQDEDNYTTNNTDKIISFDAEDTINIDDALSVRVDGNIYILGVYIADPTPSIEKSLIIRDEALKRGRSLYYQNECIAPMLPLELSKKYSLFEGKVRKTINCYFYFDISTNSLIDFRITNEPVRLFKNLTFNDFNNAYYKGKGHKKVNELVNNLCEISPILEKHFRRDAIFKEINKSNEKDVGAKVVSNCTIMTNYYVIKEFIENNIGCIFKNHVLISEVIEKMRNLKEKLILLNDDNINYSNILKNEYPKPYYSSVNKGHAGLDLDCYGQITSPLVRFPDNINIIGVKKFMIGNPYSEKDLELYQKLVEQTCEGINSRTYYTKKYEKEMAKRLSKKIKN